MTIGFDCRQHEVLHSPISSLVSTGITAKPQHNAIDPPKEVVLKRVAEMMKDKMDISNLLSRAPSKKFNRYLIKSSRSSYSKIKLFHKQENNRANCYCPIRSNGLNDQESDTQAEEFFQLLSVVTEKEDLKVS